MKVYEVIKDCSITYTQNGEWTLIDDINLVDPRINQITVKDACKFHPLYGQAICKDVTANLS